MNILKDIIKAPINLYLRNRHGLDKSKTTITVIGAGSFGTVIANIIAENGYKTYLWTRTPEQADFIRTYRRNPRYIKHVKLSRNIKPTHDIKKAVSNNVDCIFFAVPSHSFEALLEEITPYMNKEQYFVSMIKGLGNYTNFALISQILEKKLKKLGMYNNNNIGVMCGPNLALEMAQKQITGTVIASKNDDLVGFVQAVVSSHYLHVFKSVDIVGVELGGILKNIYSIAVGICDGLQYGLNTKSFLFTRSLIEIIQFGTKLKANPISFIGLAGVGDLIATSHSEYSRNYNFGYRVATSSKPAIEIIESMNEIVEGMNTLDVIYEEAKKLKVEMPILTALYQIIHGKKNIYSAIHNLLRKASVVNLDLSGVIDNIKLK